MKKFSNNNIDMSDEEMIHALSYEGIKLNARYNQIINLSEITQRDLVVAELLGDTENEQMLKTRQKELDKKAEVCLIDIQKHNKALNYFSNRIKK